MAGGTAEKTQAYTPIRSTRSDGKGYDYGRFDEKTKTKACEDPTIDARWRIHLGGYLKRELATGEHTEKDYVLEVLPDGYELRQTNVNSNSTSDKKDYAIFGHPHGKTCRFRTPGEFAVHLLWLCSDSMNWEDCSCDWCAKLVEGTKLKQLQVAGSSVQPSAVRAPAPAPAPALAPPPSTNPAVAPAQPPPTPPVAPTILPGTTGPCNVFRIAELVWYRLNAAWRLGVIFQIQPKETTDGNGDDSAYSFQLVPLGHAVLPQPIQVKVADEMRPFLTFSVPNTQLPELQDKSFTDIDWPVYVNQRSQDPSPEKESRNKQVVGLEASKMAAKCVNNAFSTFNPLRQAQNAATGVVESTFGGVFFGAEMVHVGDPVRVTPSDANASGTTVMRVAQILVAESPGAVALYFRGGVYRLGRSPQGPGAFSIQPEQLGPAFQEEVLVRNQFEGEQGVAWGWMQIEPDAMRSEHDVQGRFYVTHRLMKIIAPDQLQEAVEKRNLGDQQQSLNNRGHKNGAPWMGRQSNRAATFGPSVSVQIVLPPGIMEN
ncbi:hypothetical protein GQ53DRAFT_793063 [Thozetella sp. PMI_491]|nr:hypothetical protein GQ53DRAFT_793063 [Thozetella sp. PMI_491]